MRAIGWSWMLGAWMLTGCNLAALRVPATSSGSGGVPAKASAAGATWLGLSTPSRVGEVIAAGAGIVVSERTFLDLDIGARWRSYDPVSTASGTLLGSRATPSSLCLYWRDLGRSWDAAGGIVEQCRERSTGEWSRRPLPAASGLATGRTIHALKVVGQDVWRIEGKPVDLGTNVGIDYVFLKLVSGGWTVADTLRVPDVIPQEFPMPQAAGDRLCFSVQIGTLRCGVPGGTWATLDSAGTSVDFLYSQADTLVFAQDGARVLRWEPTSGAVQRRAREGWMDSLLLSSSRELVRPVGSGRGLEHWKPGAGWRALDTARAMTKVWRIDSLLVQVDPVADTTRAIRVRLP